MTLTEFKETIATSPNVSWFQAYKLRLNYPNINFDVTFEGVVALYEFVLNQVDGYTDLENLTSELVEVKKIFKDAKTKIINLVVGNNLNAILWKNELTRLVSNSPIKFLYNSPETQLLIRVHLQTPVYYLGVFEYFSGSTQHVTNKDNLIGYLLAYEFTSKDISQIAERTETERKSLSKIREDFQKRLGESETEMTNYLSQANQKYIDYSNKIDEFQKEKEGNYNSWFKSTSQDFDKFRSGTNTKIKELEDLYIEKLKLEAPAKYWSDRAKKLRKEGYWWLIGLITMVLAAMGILIWSLSEISNGVLAKIFQNNGTAIKWSVVFITLISFIAFAIRIFSKLTFSSFHLVRDAEEREQLTYVYLALKKEKGIDETERHLIMQSLFSRADTGLLKDDAGPTMPGSIADRIMPK